MRDRHDASFHFSKALYRMRADVRDCFGEKYQEMICPVMDSLRAGMRLRGISLLKEFERCCKPLLVSHDKTTVWILGAAVVELYELRERLFLDVGRDQ